MAVTADAGRQLRAHLDFTFAFGKAAPDEECERAAIARHVVIDDCVGEVNPMPATRRGDPDAKVGIFGSRLTCKFAEAAAESTDCVKRRGAHRHVSRPHVACAGPFGRHPRERSADGPRELVGKPGWLSGEPVWSVQAARADDGLVGERCNQSADPLNRRGFVVIEKRDERGSGDCCACVSRCRGASVR